MPEHILERGFVLDVVVAYSEGIRFLYFRLDDHFLAATILGRNLSQMIRHLLVLLPTSMDPAVQVTNSLPAVWWHLPSVPEACILEQHSTK